jgi:[acyl-carrier-protein] S-malonyltransferase
VRPASEGKAPAWVFPGQGSQAVGAGLDLGQGSPAARQVFEQADAVVGVPLTRLCFYGPEEELTQTINAQPAIMAVSLACLAAARQAGLTPPAFVAGHRPGEYTALVAAGSLTPEDGLSLVRERGRLMQEAGERGPGTLAAILGLEEEPLLEGCRRTGAEVCNINAPGQIVIGGRREVVAAALEEAKAAGARRAMELKVSGAFHTSLMRPAVEGMSRALESARLRDPDVPVVANARARPLTTAKEVREELITQLDHPVLWQRSIEYMAGQGVTTYVEIGPGSVLTGLVRRIVPEAQAVNIDGLAAVERMLPQGVSPGEGP